MCGPLLFSLYINDIPKSLKYAQTSLYADDTVIYLSNHDATSACNLLQHDLNLLQNWCDMNRMTINCKKTNIVHMDEITSQKK